MYQIVSLYISFYQSKECPDPFIVVSPWLTVSITGQQMFARTLWRSKPLFLRPFLIRHQDHTNAILNHQISTPAQRSPHYYSPRPCCSESSDKDTWNRWNSVDLICSRLARSSPCLWTWRFFLLHLLRPVPARICSQPFWTSPRSPCWYAASSTPSVAVRILVISVLEASPHLFHLPFSILHLAKALTTCRARNTQSCVV